MTTAKNFRDANSQRGLTLVELLVAIAIALVVILAATSVLIIGEEHKRSTTGTEDANQSGAYSAYSLDRALRSAGSGFAQAWNSGVFGCKLSANSLTDPSTQILPRTKPFPAPFAGFLAGAPGSLVVAPVLIGKDMSEGGSDVLAVMTGNGSAGDVTRPIKSWMDDDSGLRVGNTIGLRNKDVALVSEPTGEACELGQVKVTDASAFAAIGNEVLPIGDPSASLILLSKKADAYFAVLGNAAANNIQFQLFGVNANRTLVAYDLLRASETGTNLDPIHPMADGVLELHAIYGIDTNTPYDNRVDAWVAPTGEWALDKVMADPVKMRRIVSVRIALVVRASNYEKGQDDKGVTVERPALFSDTSAAISADTYPEGDERRHFRLRVIDATVPLRNMLLLGAS